MSFTDYLEAKLLDYVWGKQAFVQLDTVYVGLCTDVAEDGTVTGEPTIGALGYTRVAVTNNDTNFPDAVGGSKANGAIIAFPEASGSWGTLDTFFFSDAASGGNILAYGALGVEKTITSGDTASFDIGALTFTLN